MTAAIIYALAAVAIAALAWDAARRAIGKRYSDDEIAKINKRMDVLKERVDEQVKTLVTDVRATLAEHNQKTAGAVAQLGRGMRR